MNWIRAALYGIAVWLVPFAAAFVLFGVRESNRALFESLITVVAVVSAVAASLLFFRGDQTGWRSGLAVGVLWAAISIVIDLPIFLAFFQMGVLDYGADIAVSYLCIPAVTLGIATAMYIGRERQS